MIYIVTKTLPYAKFPWYVFLFIVVTASVGVQLGVNYIRTALKSHKQ
jgi:hypothetical protein